MSRGKVNGAFVQAMPPRPQWKRVNKGAVRPKVASKRPEEEVLAAQREAIESANGAALKSASAAAMRRLGDRAEASRYEREAVAAHRRRRKAEAIVSKALGAKVEVRRSASEEARPVLGFGAPVDDEVAKAVEDAVAP